MNKVMGQVEFVENVYPGHTGFFPGHTGFFPGHTGFFPGHTGFFPDFSFEEQDTSTLSGCYPPIINTKEQIVVDTGVMYPEDTGHLAITPERFFFL
jgi:hypothetical protein